jgi:hypothetical protein
MAWYSVLLEVSTAAIYRVLYGAAAQLFQSYPYLQVSIEGFISDRARKALTEASLLGEPRIYDTILRCSSVPLTTLYYHDYRQSSIEAKA